jgi:DNA topoisomerase-1
MATAKTASTARTKTAKKAVPVAPKAKAPKAARLAKAGKKVAAAEVDARVPAPRATRVSGNTLVVVESPAKAKTIKKYLGAGYTVKASVGHIMDLPKSKIGVDVENDFEPIYEVIESKKKVVAELKAAAKLADRILLATDPDREGEAIAWHIRTQFAKNKVPTFRVLFNEITKKAINEAIEKPLQLNQALYDAQQARRVLDRLVGYQISPILWKKVRRGLSAGRVQSVGVRLVVEREEQIRKFVPVEYWSLEADLKAALPPQFRSKLIKLDGKKAELGNAEATLPLVDQLKNEAFTVQSVEKKERRRNAPPPFITSKLQQEAANRLHFTAKKTMTLSQRLYEGVELGDEGQTALITYMRTDSVRLSADAIASARGYIGERFGKDYLPPDPVVFKTKKSAQDAHEAIRPTNIEYPPERVQPFLERDMFRLYELIWNRFVACQMTPAVFDQTTADIQAGNAVFRATGQTTKFAGYLAVYGEQAVSDEPAKIEEAGAEKMEGEDDEKGDLSRQLPPLESGQKLQLVQLIPEQHFTQPPPRFTEASLVKELEEKGIGRPSTYAAILSTIQDKEYVEKKENRFYPTELGKLVTELLMASFPTVMDVEFTAKMEGELDEVEEGSANWVKVLNEFYGPFKKTLVAADEQMRDVKREEQKTDLVCEKCGSPMVIKWGRMGRFLACSGYPDCKNTKDFVEKDGKIEIALELPTDEKCPTCGKPMVNKRGRFGRFLACSDYPTCKTTKKITLKDVVCPEDGGGLAERKSRFGKSFWGCVNYPNCKFVAWDRPLGEPCPQCGSKYLLSKYSKREGAFIACPNKECGYRREAPEPGTEVAPKVESA